MAAPLRRADRHQQRGTRLSHAGLCDRGRPGRCTAGLAAGAARRRGTAGSGASRTGRCDRGVRRLGAGVRGGCRSNAVWPWIRCPNCCPTPGWPSGPVTPSAARCICRPRPETLSAAVDQINAVLPSASLVTAAELHRSGWAGLADDVIGVAETRAGYVSPAGLRANVLADLAQRRITFLDARLGRAGTGRRGPVARCPARVRRGGGSGRRLDARPADRLRLRPERPEHQRHPVHDPSSRRCLAQRLRRRPERVVRPSRTRRGAARPAHSGLGNHTVRARAGPSAVAAGSRRGATRVFRRCGSFGLRPRRPRSTATPPIRCLRCDRSPVQTGGCSASAAVPAARSRPRWPPAIEPPGFCRTFLPRCPSNLNSNGASSRHDRSSHGNGAVLLRGRSGRRASQSQLGRVVPDHH